MHAAGHLDDLAGVVAAAVEPVEAQQVGFHLVHHDLEVPVGLPEVLAVAPACPPFACNLGVWMSALSGSVWDMMRS